MDAPFDRQVARCRHRPVARGAVSPLLAHLFTLGQSIVGAVILLGCFPDATIPALPLIITLGLYPFAKRFTNYPQVLLGFLFASGQLVGAAAMGMTIWPQNQYRVTSAVSCFYMANVLNTVIYDAVYAHQDLKNDLKAGVKSVAVAWQSWTKHVLTVLSVVEVLLLANVGLSLGMGRIYGISAVVGTATALGSMIYSVDLEAPESCWKWFHRTVMFTGLTLCLSLFREYTMRFYVVWMQGSQNLMYIYPNSRGSITKIDHS